MVYHPSLINETLYEVSGADRHSPLESYDL